MKNTIKSKNGGYEVQSLTTYGNHFAILDGNSFLFVATLRSYAEYVDEVINGGNECAMKFEIFTDNKKDQYIYWGDYETGEDFITQVY